MTWNHESSSFLSLFSFFLSCSLHFFLLLFFFSFFLVSILFSYLFNFSFSVRVSCGIASYRNKEKTFINTSAMTRLREPIPRCKNKKADSRQYLSVSAVPETVCLSYDSATVFLIPHFIFFLHWLGQLDTRPYERKRRRRKDIKAFLPWVPRI